MATPPTFSTGAVLTAAQMNSVGLWLVKSQTVGSGVSSVTVTGAFNADYENYRIIISGVDCASGGFVWYTQLGGVASNYYGSLYIDAYTGASTTTFRTNAGISLPIGVQDLDNTTVCLDVLRPYVNTVTTLNGNHYGGGYSGWVGGAHAANASHTSINFYLGSGTMTGGTIKIYGYRN